MFESHCLRRRRSVSSILRGNSQHSGHAMIRALVLLLILPTLLMPPGMCICRLMPAASATPTPAFPSGKTTASHAADPRPDCSCDSCRARAAALAHSGSGTEPTSPSPSDSGPAKHSPGCPAAADAAPLGLLLPTTTVQVDFVATSGLFTTISELVVSTVRVAPVPKLDCSPPLFISHCTLLI